MDDWFKKAKETALKAASEAQNAAKMAATEFANAKEKYNEPKAPTTKAELLTEMYRKIDSIEKTALANNELLQSLKKSIDEFSEDMPELLQEDEKSAAEPADAPTEETKVQEPPQAQDKPPSGEKKD